MALFQGNAFRIVNITFLKIVHDKMETVFMFAHQFRREYAFLSK